MAHLFDNAREDVGYDVEEAPRPRRWGTVLGVLGLVLLGAGSAFAWHNWGNGFPALPALPGLPSFASVTAPVPDTEKPVALRDFQALQQQTAAAAQSTAQSLAGQQAEIKRLSDQVAALTAKISALQLPPPAPAPAPAAAPPAAPPAAPAARKRPAAARPAPPAISVGGAPLPPPR